MIETRINVSGGCLRVGWHELAVDNVAQVYHVSINALLFVAEGRVLRSTTDQAGAPFFYLFNLRWKPSCFDLEQFARASRDLTILRTADEALERVGYGPSAKEDVKRAVGGAVVLVDLRDVEKKQGGTFVRASFAEALPCES